MATIKILGVEVEAPEAEEINNIQGRPYLTVKGKLALLKRVLAAKNFEPTAYSILSTVVTPPPAPNWVFVDALLEVPWGRYGGTAGSNLLATDRRFNKQTEKWEDVPAIQANSPAEMAQTGAVGRALGMAGIDPFGNIESADAMKRAGADKEDRGSRTESSFSASARTSYSGDPNRPTLVLPEPNDGMGGFVCEDVDCDTEIAASGKYTAAQNAGYSVRATGKILCGRHRKEAEEAAGIGKAR